MEYDEKIEERDELKPLDPKKYLVRKVFRRYGKEKLIKPKRAKKPFYLEFPRKTKEFLSKVKRFVVHNISMVIIFILLVVIALFALSIFLPQTPNASFIDKMSREYIYGYVYFDETFLGDTDGIMFKGFPKDYCNGTHVVRIESEKDAFEWQTYAVDCKSKKVIFYVHHEQAQPSIYVVLKFLDSTGSFYIIGNLYFDDVFVQKVDRSFSILRTECKNITKIRLEHEDIYDEWDNNIEFCDDYDEIKFKSSLK